MTTDGTTKAVQIIDLSVDVKHSFSKFNIDFDKPYFSEVEPYYTDKRPNGHFGILQIHSLNQKLDRLNGYKSNGKKDNAPAFLKGIYNGGTSGVNCVIPAGFLFFDIDVKDNENAHLKCGLKNAQAFEIIKKYSLLIWRSNSGLGIAGLLYVPQLKDVDHSNSKLHLNIGKAITDALANELKTQNIIVSFDEAQSKFRQIRFLAEQKEQRSFNPLPALFEYSITETPRIYHNGVKAYRNADFSPIDGSIEHQYNQRNKIQDVLRDCHFENVNGNRWKHPRTTSGNSGFVDEVKNIFLNFSGSFSGKGGFSPFRLACYYLHNDNKQVFEKTLTAQGYKVIEPTKEAVKTAEMALSKRTKRSDKDIFSICDNLQNLPYCEKLDFINKNCKSEAERPLFFEYLKIKSLLISYDKTIKIEKYVSEAFSEILKYTDQHKKVIVRAETGTGKTFSVITEFTKQRPDHRCLIIAPLTVIVDQTKKEHNITGLTGQSRPLEHMEALTANIVIATQEQAIKHLSNGNTFDYIVIDEMHNFLTANSYKRELLAELTFLIKDKKVIGLTATPNEVFKNIGYRLLSVEKHAQKRTKVIQRSSNLPAFRIILEHEKTVKQKTVYRLNSKSTLEDIKAELIANGLNESDIFLIYSEKHIKDSRRFKGMVNDQQFPADAKVILTTAIIDEGLNIYQNDFSDVVFIDDQFTPRTESLKQFYARFRNDDENRINYHYRKFKKDQTVNKWNWQWNYNKRLKNLIDEVNGMDDFNSFNDLANDSDFYYKDHTVNKYYLGFSVTEQFFERLTVSENNEYLRLNYNLDIEVDNIEFESSISTDRTKVSNNKKHGIIYKRWIIEDEKEAIKKIVKKHTSKPKLKRSIQTDSFFIVDDENPLTKDVCFYLSDFERLILETEKLNLLTEQPADEILFEDEKLRNKQTYNRWIQRLENQSLMVSPKTKYDYKNRQKVLNFVNEAIKLKHFQMRDLLKIWQKQRVSSVRGYKNFYLLDLLEDNIDDSLKIIENKKDKTFSFEYNF
ncbi:DEAD/DEAH box helicase [Gelidibacter salicanalis]|uniref:DEAD/DEAH box helicase n=1 Tax=Gelidibacter salicanalis TaxID=291193 RepID=A0A5C7AXP0_9FLAO|nr:DEAD/DEAH box helicase family protein [Gelidibacter salicanalis]TXE10502.1 DEAD/DEAH box helicase [Gelidibacter salicanalis]